MPVLVEERALERSRLTLTLIFTAAQIARSFSTPSLMTHRLVITGIPRLAHRLQDVVIYNASISASRALGLLHKMVH